MSVEPGASPVDGIDAAYLLVQRDDWTAGLRGNRWHWARRWSERVPTVVVEPTRDKDALAGAGSESAIPNLRVLRVDAPGSAVRVGRGLDLAGRIASDIEEHGYECPLLWSWNPQLAIPFGAVPAAARVYHATESYFDMGLPESFLAQLRASISIADLVVAVSLGVADRIAAQSRPRALAVVTNGVDYPAYAHAAPDRELREAAGDGSQRIAIYAGNVNARLDLRLLHECAARFEDTTFAFYGRVRLSDPEESRAWEALIARPNTAFFGEVPPDRLPALYAAADVGIIPYTHDPLLVENGFPLKLLEMAAAGLPVVSTHMRCIAGLAEPLVVAETSEEFVHALETRLRRSATPEELAELDLVARQNDHDVKFREAAAALGGRLETPPRVTVRLDPALEAVPEQWRKVLKTRAVRPAGKPQQGGRVGVIRRRPILRRRPGRGRR